MAKNGRWWVSDVTCFGQTALHCLYGLACSNFRVKMSSTLLRRCRADHVFVFLLSLKEVLNCVWRGNCQLPTQTVLRIQLEWLRFTAFYLCHTQVKVDPLVGTTAFRLLDSVSTSLLYLIFCVTLWRFLRGEGLCLHCIERYHVIQYRRLRDPTQEIMWSNTGDHVIQHRRSIQEIRGGRTWLTFAR